MVLRYFLLFISNFCKNVFQGYTYDLYVATHLVNKFTDQASCVLFVIYMDILKLK